MTVDMTNDVPPEAIEYAFSNSSPQAEKQLSSLEEYLDPITSAYLQGISAPQPGTRCLELGPGRGSITRMLIDRVGAAGRVIAVDRDPNQLISAPNLEIVHHDLQRGLPVEGPFSLIHARLLLVHLPNRRHLLQQLAEALAPGGWLAIGEFCFDDPLTVLAANGEDDATLFTQVVETTKDLLVQQHGVELAWARHIYGAMGAAGLQRAKPVEHHGTWIGGDAGCELLVACASQKHEQLLAAGLSEADLQRFYELMANPDFSCQSWPFVYTLGKKPLASPTIWVP